MMKKQYEKPQVERIDFNYLESVVASGNLKAGADINGCYHGANAKKNCTPIYR